MAHAVFIKNPDTGCHYRRSIWYRDINKAKASLRSWMLTAADCATTVDNFCPILVEDTEEEGEVT